MLAAIWQDIGFIRWPMSFSILMVIALTLYSSAQLFKPGAWADLRTKVFVDGVFFWGAFTLLAGMLGSLLGIIIAFQSVEAAGEVSPALIAGGLKVALLSSSFGFLVMGGAALVWFCLQFRWRMLHAKEAQEV